MDVRRAHLPGPGHLHVHPGRRHRPRTRVGPPQRNLARQRGTRRLRGATRGRRRSSAGGRSGEASICSKPAICSCSLTVSALAIENGPGPQVGSSVSSGSSRYWSTTCSARWIHSLSSLRRQTTAQSRPPGRSAPRTLRSACHRVGEEHHPHPREGVVEGPSQVRHLDVAGDEARRSRRRPPRPPASRPR